MSEYFLNSNVIFGGGSIDYLTKYKNLNVTIVTDPALKELGMTDKIEALLMECSVSVYSDIKPDPTLTQVTECYKFVKAKKTDILLAFGGGSAIDTAKAVILVDSTADSCSKMQLVAIPTTAGTGSEVTNYTVVKDEIAGRKIPLMDDRMIPKLAILDYTLTKTVPGSVTAATGMDVMTHAIEAYVSTKANLITDSFAEKAISLAHDNLYVAYKEGSNDNARENMLMASYIAGLAFTGAGLGINHSIAHALGAAFGIAHGKANAIVLPHVVAFNSGLDVPFGTDKSEVAKKYARIAQVMGLPAGGTRLCVQNLVHELQAMNRQMGIPATLLQLGIDRANFMEHRSKIIESVLLDGCTACNPKQPNAGDIGKLLDKIYQG